ncbi:methyltransferase domain-containing protein [Paenibacillus nuruki]|uniref:methyltransferase domain-containing protein n=1 Tax=Paenibacillus nuruki TaxID=1886670 RepID=UPI002805094C|nr:class I SAM-dependent methyltransferase [Paenibacillus nuruki]CAJ1317472.1 MTS domain-containing protein [Paenibacillus nuruki]
MDTGSLVVSTVLLVVVLIAVLSIVYYSWRNGISPLPASALIRSKIAEEVLRLSKIQELDRPLFKLKIDDPVERYSTIQQHMDYKTRPKTIIETGSGWGTLAIFLAKHCPEYKVTGIENSFIPFWISKLWARFEKVSVNWIRGDMYQYPYEEANMIICYLFPGAMKRLNPILRERATTYTYIISVYFALPDWTPEKVVQCVDIHRTKIYIYKV